MAYVNSLNDPLKRNGACDLPMGFGELHWHRMLGMFCHERGKGSSVGIVLMHSAKEVVWCDLCSLWESSVSTSVSRFYKCVWFYPLNFATTLMKGFCTSKFLNIDLWLLKGTL